MVKSDIVNALAQKHGIQPNIAAQILDLVLDGFTEELVKGGRIEIRGFGTFAVRNYDGYTGRNPKIGEAVTVSPKKLPFFKASKFMKGAINQGKA